MCICLIYHDALLLLVVMLKQLSSAKCFGGVVKVFSHESVATKTEMKFTVFLPSKASSVDTEQINAYRCFIQHSWH